MTFAQVEHGRLMGAWQRGEIPADFVLAHFAKAVQDARVKGRAEVTARVRTAMKDNAANYSMMAALHRALADDDASNAEDKLTGQELCQCGHNAWTEHGGIMMPPAGCDLCNCILNERQAARLDVIYLESYTSEDDKEES